MGVIWPNLGRGYMTEKGFIWGLGYGRVCYLDARKRKSRIEIRVKEGTWYLLLDIIPAASASISFSSIFSLRKEWVERVRSAAGNTGP